MKLFRFIMYAFALSCCFATRVNAGLIINEIMYDLQGTDTDHEWIELYNSSSSEISIEGYKFNDGANHGLNTPPVNGGAGSLLISAGGYAVLSANASVFKSDYPSYSGTVIDTVMSLANEGDTISIVDSNNDVIDSITYTKSQGGAGDGNSLGSFGSALFPGVPSPGKENTKSVSSNEPEEETEPNEIEVKEDSIPKFAGTITIDEPITSGVPVRFSTLIVNTERKVVLPGKYVWNFGDGTVYEYYDGLPFSHTYSDAGEYVVNFEFYKSKGSFTPDVVVKKVVSVSEGGVIISSVGTPSSPKIELMNTTDINVDMSYWKISSNGRNYIFPPQTTILRNGKISMRPGVLGFVPIGTVSLVHPSGAIASSMSYVTPKDPTTLSNDKMILSQKESVDDKDTIKSTGPVDPVESSAELLQASTGQLLSDDMNKKEIHALVYYSMFIFVVILAVYAVIRIRKRDRDSSESLKEYDADEFTLVE